MSFLKYDHSVEGNAHQQIVVMARKSIDQNYRISSFDNFLCKNLELSIKLIGIA